MSDRIVPPPDEARTPRGVVAVGASAGGLEALQQFFENAPLHAGIAYVVVQHLSPDHKSLMVELLGRHTVLRVVRAEDGMPLAPDTIFLNSPKANLTLEDGLLRIREPPNHAGLRLPIDTFFESLAAARGEEAVGVVLSGTGSDGTRGARELKAEGGLILVQDPEEAQFDGMPRSVIATGLADQVAPVATLPTFIAQFFSRRAQEQSRAAPLEGGDTTAQLQRVLTLLRDTLGNDFSGYKPTTILRRIDRRVLMHPGLGWDDYVRLLEGSRTELARLNRDLLIGVTRFFRDEDAFAALTGLALPELLDSLPADQELRVWVTACSTGEEAYSILMVLLETLERRGEKRSVRVFATDVDPDAIEFAAAGRYAESLTADVSPERLVRFFVRDGDGYRVARHVRDRVIFARHNLIKDPPLTRMDLVTCRNMLIYLGSDLQRRVIALLAYALHARGVLFLGSSETVGSLASLFKVLDPKAKLYRALQPGRHTLGETLPLRARRAAPLLPHGTMPGDSLARLTRPGNHAENIALEGVLQEMTELLGVRCVILDADHCLVHAFGDVSDLLTVPVGRSTLEIFRMVPKALAAALRSAFARLGKEQRQVSYRGVETRPGEPSVNVHVRALARDGAHAAQYMVFFQQGVEPLTGGTVDDHIADDGAQVRLAQLEHELQYTKENLQATIEELETSNEELQATNEELLASNEELQSTNEELQSVNEELQTVNSEYQQKIDELIAMSDDVENLLRSTGVGTLFLDDRLCIRKYTDAASQLLNLLPQDVGRPLGHIASKLPGLDVVGLCQRMLTTGVAQTLDLTLADGTSLHVKAMPFLTQDRAARGAIVSIIDVTAVKRGESRLQEILDSIPSCLAVLARDGTIVQTNRAWSDFARDNGGSAALIAGVGLNYLSTVASTPADPIAMAAAIGLRDVLEGRRTSFELQYPCHSPTQQRYFVLQVTSLRGGGLPGAIAQHLDVSETAIKLERLSRWADEVHRLGLSNLPAKVS